MAQRVPCMNQRVCGVTFHLSGTDAASDCGSAARRTGGSSALGSAPVSSVANDAPVSRNTTEVFLIAVELKSILNEAPKDARIGRGRGTHEIGEQIVRELGFEDTSDPDGDEEEWADIVNDIIADDFDGEIINELNPQSVAKSLLSHPSMRSPSIQNLAEKSNLSKSDLALAGDARSIEVMSSARGQDREEFARSMTQLEVRARALAFEDGFDPRASMARLQDAGIVGPSGMRKPKRG